MVEQNPNHLLQDSVCIAGPPDDRAVEREKILKGVRDGKRAADLLPKRAQRAPSREEPIPDRLEVEENNKLADEAPANEMHQSAKAKRTSPRPEQVNNDQSTNDQADSTQFPDTLLKGSSLLAELAKELNKRDVGQIQSWLVKGLKKRVEEVSSALERHLDVAVGGCYKPRKADQPD